MIAGSVQSREAALQVLPPSAAPQGPTADQRTQPLGAEERPDAANGHGTRPVGYARTNPHPHGKIGIATTASTTVRVPSRAPFLSLSLDLSLSLSLSLFCAIDAHYLGFCRLPFSSITWLRLIGQSKQKRSLPCHFGFLGSFSASRRLFLPKMNPLKTPCARSRAPAMKTNQNKHHWRSYSLFNRDSRL